MAGIERALHGGEVDGGFAGAGDAVEQDGAEGALGEGEGDVGEGFGLGLVEGVLVGVLFTVGEDAAEVEVFGGVFDGDEVALDERGQC